MLALILKYTILQSQKSALWRLSKLCVYGKNIMSPVQATDN